jgi:outer membrane protein assembly factor BamD
MQNILRNIIIYSLLFAVAACSGDADVTGEKEVASAEILYEQAQAKMAKKSYQEAVEEFQEIERQYPFSPLATRAQVMAAFAYYKDQEYDDALVILERFIKLHPGNVDIAYAYYLRALCYYERIVDIKRDQEMTELALDALNDVIIRFANTDYARDAKLKLDLANDHLAGKEMEIGRFYQKRGEYIAAINRFKVVIDKFDTTTHTPEALYRLTEIYLTLGVEDEARRNASVLGHNYPDSKWYRYAYRLAAGGADSPLPKKKDAWFSGIFDEDNDQIKKQAGDEKSWLDDMIDIF